MASIRKEIQTKASAENAWAALRDIGALHTRLVPGFVTDTRLEGNTRVVTFGNGLVIRERILDVNNEHRRVAWSATGGTLTHHNGSAQVFQDQDGSTRIIWIADLLPDEAAPQIAAMMDQGMRVMKETLDRLS